MRFAQLEASTLCTGWGCSGSQPNGFRAGEKKGNSGSPECVGAEGAAGKPVGDTLWPVGSRLGVALTWRVPGQHERFLCGIPYVIGVGLAGLVCSEIWGMGRGESSLPEGLSFNCSPQSFPQLSENVVNRMKDPGQPSRVGPLTPAAAALVSSEGREKGRPGWQFCAGTEWALLLEMSCRLSPRAVHDVSASHERVAPKPGAVLFKDYSAV